MNSSMSVTSSTTSPSTLKFYTTHLGFKELTNFAPAFADVARGQLRLLLSGPASSAARPMPNGQKPACGRLEPDPSDRRRHSRRRLARLRDAGVKFRSDIVTGPGGAQIVLDDPSGNPIELFQPAGRGSQLRPAVDGGLRMIYGMNHFTITAEDRAKTLDYYCGLLGLQRRLQARLGLRGCVALCRRRAGGAAHLLGPANASHAHRCHRPPGLQRARAEGTRRASTREA